MNFEPGAVCVIGRHGFIGSALAAYFGDATPFPTPETRIIFHVGSYTHMDFDKNPSLHQRLMYDSYAAYLQYCAKHGITFVYPSSALVYEAESNFSRFKLALESLVRSYHDVTSLGLRIFPAYGPGESRSVISQWCQAMANGERPVVFGDGEQSRDFIYIDDVVDQTVALCEELKDGEQLVRDIGTGALTRFNTIVQDINAVLETDYQPLYQQGPVGYRREGVRCVKPLPVNLFPGTITIRKILATYTEAKSAN